MKKVLVLVLALALGACAQFQKFQQVYTLATETTVPAQAVVVAANAFDAIEGTAAQYFVYCRTNLSTPACSADNRRTIIRTIRSGRAARNKLETYIAGNTPAPSVIYNTLIAAINTLQASAIQGVQK